MDTASADVHFAFTTWSQGEYRITTDPAAADIDVIHRYLSQDSYWAKGIPRELVARSIAHSLPFSVLHGDALIGFGRVTSDRATFAYLCDVFVLPGHRGNGLSKWLVQCVRAHPQLQGLRRWLLATADAHTLYRRFGFLPMAAPERWMEIHDRAVYSRPLTAEHPA